VLHRTRQTKQLSNNVAWEYDPPTQKKFLDLFIFAAERLAATALKVFRELCFLTLARTCGYIQRIRLVMRWETISAASRAF
jgi:hypothetical protein